MTSVQDIRVAFDSIPHTLIMEALLGRGVSAHCTGLHTRELTRLQGHMVIPLVGKTRSFLFEKGEKQGGDETLDVWRPLIDFVLEPVIKNWNSVGMGFRLEEDGGRK